MDNNLRQIVLNELYKIAYKSETVIVEGASNLPPKVITIAQPEKNSAKDKAIAKKKVELAALKCGWGKDVEGYRKSGWHCKNNESPFRTTADLRTWRTWLQSEMPQEYKKLGVPAIEASETPGDIKTYYQYIEQYAKYQKLQGKPTPGLDDADSGELSGLAWITIGIVAVKVVGAIAGSALIRGVIQLFRKRKGTNSRSATPNKGLTKLANLATKSNAQFLDQMASNPQAMRAEMKTAAKMSNADLRASIAEVTGKPPSKITNNQLDEFRAALRDPAITREVIVSSRKMIISSFMKNKGEFTADQVINLMTRNERVKYEKYIRGLDKRRNRP